MGSAVTNQTNSPSQRVSILWTVPCVLASSGEEDKARVTHFPNGGFIVMYGANMDAVQVRNRAKGALL